MAPLVVKGKVLVGNRGGEFGVRGWLDGARRRRPARSSGRAYSTGPDSDVLIGPDFKPFYATGPAARTSASRPGRRTRGRSAAARCGAGSPTTPSSNLDLLRHRQPRPVEPGSAARRQQVDRRHLRPRPRHRRGALVLPVEPARPATTTTASTRTMLLDLPIGRAARARCSSTPSATATSTCSTARPARCCRPSPFVHVNVAARASTSKTGRLQSTSGQGAASRTRSCATSARPRPARRTGSRRRSRRAPGCSTSRTTTCAWTARASRRTTSPARRTSAPNVQHVRRARRHIAASSPPGTRSAQAQAWTHQGEASRSGAARSRPPATSSSTERWTAGSRRSTPRTGELLWQFKTGSGIIGQPITYRGPDGKQYVAVLSGVGGWAGAIVSGDLDPRDGTAALGFVNAMTRPEGRHDAREAALCLRAAVAWRCVVGLLALACAGGAAVAARELRVCADPNNLPFSNERGRRLREPDRRADRPAISARRVATPGGRSGAASSARR